MHRPPPLPAHVIRRLQVEHWERKRQDAKDAEEWIRKHEGSQDQRQHLPD